MEQRLYFIFLATDMQYENLINSALGSICPGQSRGYQQDFYFMLLVNICIPTLMFHRFHLFDQNSIKVIKETVDVYEYAWATLTKCHGWVA